MTDDAFRTAVGFSSRYHCIRLLGPLRGGQLKWRAFFHSLPPKNTNSCHQMKFYLLPHHYHHCHARVNSLLACLSMSAAISQSNQHQYTHAQQIRSQSRTQPCTAPPAIINAKAALRTFFFFLSLTSLRGSPPLNQDFEFTFF